MPAFESKCKNVKRQPDSYSFSPATSVADPDPFDTDPDPAFHLETDPDPDFQFDTDPGPAVFYGSGSLPLQRGNVPKTIRYFLHTFA
jgi:hypothetical protein